MFISVDLPEPEAPMMATISPGATSRSTPRSARTSVWPIVNVLSRPTVRMTLGWCRLSLVLCSAMLGPFSFRSPLREDRAGDSVADSGRGWMSSSGSSRSPRR